jgi:NAD(P)-dependent dehydrogenase (short-subunit alcohol dehydrogenase family)
VSRSVVVTGASRGLGLATATHLHRTGWHVVAAMRTPEEGLERLRAATGAAADDPRLTAVRLDLTDPEAVVGAARSIEDAVGAPDGIVHNAGLAVAGVAEETPPEAWELLFRTNLFGPVQLTNELLPSMRAAGRGRIVVVASQGGLRGMASVSAYSAAKAAVERWAEALAGEIAPFGLGVTVLVPGAFATDILELTQSYARPTGPYAQLCEDLERRGRKMVRFAAPPERFAPAVERALGEHGPYRRHAVGRDAHVVLLANRLLPGRALHRMGAMALGLPKPGSLR